MDVLKLTPVKLDKLAHEVLGSNNDYWQAIADFMAATGQEENLLALAKCRIITHIQWEVIFAVLCSAKQWTVFSRLLPQLDDRLRDHHRRNIACWLAGADQQEPLDWLIEKHGAVLDYGRIIYGTAKAKNRDKAIQLLRTHHGRIDWQNQRNRKDLARFKWLRPVLDELVPLAA